MNDTTRHDPAVTSELATPFVIGATDVGTNKGSQAQYSRESAMVAAGSANVQPTQRGMQMYPQPPAKGDRQ